MKKDELKHNTEDTTESDLLKGVISCALVGLARQANKRRCEGCKKEWGIQKDHLCLNDISYTDVVSLYEEVNLFLLRGMYVMSNKAIPFIRKIDYLNKIKDDILNNFDNYELCQAAQTIVLNFTDQAKLYID